MALFKKEEIISSILILLVLFLAFLFKKTTISIIASIIIYAIIVFSSIESGLGIVLLLLPLSGMFDDVGFLHLFNLSVVVFSIKCFFNSCLKNKFNHNSIFALVFLIILIIYEIINAILNNIFNSSYFNNFSIWFGYILIIVLSSYLNEINPKKMFLMLFVGFIVSCGLCVVDILTKWGTEVPNEYRFVGLMRDPNYYSLIAIIIIFSSVYVFKKNIKYVFSIIAFFLGLLSVSKMFLFLCAIGIICYLLHYILMLIIEKKRINDVFIKVLFGLIIIFMVVYITGAIDFFVNKYLFRFSSYKLTTGRDYIQGSFIKILSNDTITLLFGKTLDYNKVFKIAYADSLEMVAHNTYLDLILSFGIIGTVLYLLMFKKIINMYKRFILNHNTIIFILLFMLSLLALSNLKSDNFIIYIIFIIISMHKKDIITS